MGAASAIAHDKLATTAMYPPQKILLNTIISEDFTPKKELIYHLGSTKLFKTAWNLESPKNQKSKPCSNKILATGETA
jgi:hypothetical protein